MRMNVEVIEWLGHPPPAILATLDLPDFALVVNAMGELITRAERRNKDDYFSGCHMFYVQHDQRQLVRYPEHLSSYSIGDVLDHCDNIAREYVTTWAAGSGLILGPEYCVGSRMHVNVAHLGSFTKTRQTCQA